MDHIERFSIPCDDSPITCRVVEAGELLPPMAILLSEGLNLLLVVAGGGAVWCDGALQCEKIRS